MQRQREIYVRQLGILPFRQFKCNDCQALFPSYDARLGYCRHCGTFNCELMPTSTVEYTQELLDEYQFISEPQFAPLQFTQQNVDRVLQKYYNVTGE